MSYFAASWAYNTSVRRICVCKAVVPMLRSIPRKDAQKICSGQSVVDLATAVKELVENALDAGSTQIEVKLKEFGQLSFEVSDNGKGIAVEDHAAISKKHWTSKIKEFKDLESIESFGFRGEALSSICQLAGSFSVHTRTKDDEMGVLLNYDHMGTLVSSVWRCLLHFLSFFNASMRAHICVDNKSKIRGYHCHC
jgi:DNA mismatch repair protein MutL